MKKTSLLLLAGSTLLLAGCSSLKQQSTSDVLPAQTQNIRKSIAAPFLDGEMKLDGVLDEKNWKKAGFFDDFVVFRKKKMPDCKTEVRVFHDREYLYIGVKCYEKRANVKPVNGSESVWRGDCFELFLGNMDPVPNLHQFCWGPGTARFGANSSWEHKSMIFDEYWTTETRIKLSFLKPMINHSALSFHFARLIHKYKTYVTWQYVGNDFQNIPGYAELILGSYNRAAELKFFHYAEKELSRTEYEKLNAALTVPPEKIEYGPWLFGASETEMNIGWFNHGRTGAYLEYRKKGTEKFTRIYSGFRNNNWNKDQQLHKVQLKALEKGTTYEYRIVNTVSVYSPSVVYPADGSFYTFTTHGKKDLTIAVFTDVHNNGLNMRPLLDNPKLMNSCDILVNVGDMLSNSTGVRSIFNGYLADQITFASKKPILNFRGNHEEVGCSPGTFFDVFGTPDFKGYSLNRFGDVCIIGLDISAPDQREWLKKAILTPDFQTAKHRILFAHYPPTGRNSHHSRTIMKVLDGIFTGKNPAATIDLMVSGHLHRGIFTAKNSGKSVPVVPGRRIFKGEIVPFDFYVHTTISGNPDNRMALIEAKGDSLTIKLIRVDGSVFKEFKIK